MLHIPLKLSIDFSVHQCYYTVKEDENVYDDRTNKGDDIMEPIKKAAKWTGIVFGIFALLFIIYVEVFLVKSDETTFGDIVSVAKINFGADYALLSSGSNSQTIMAKNYDKLKAFLSKNGCTKISQNGNFFYDYKTKEGRDFVVYTRTEVPGGIYSTFTIEGVTMDEIAGK